MPEGSLDTLTLLRHTPVFGELAHDVLASVTRQMQHVSLRGGQLLFSAGDPSDALYVLCSGSLGVFRPPQSGGAPHLAGVLGSGQTLGTTGLLLDQPHDMSARALRDSEVLQLSQAGFQALIDQHPQAILGAAQAALRNLLRRDGDEPRIQPRTFALLPFDRTVPMREWAEQLRHALLPFGDCLLIDAQLGRDRDATWFAQRESEVRFVLYVADGNDAHWRDLCRRQADLLMLLVRGDQRPAA